jgi:hypothetical protein
VVIDRPKGTRTWLLSTVGVHRRRTRPSTAPSAPTSSLPEIARRRSSSWFSAQQIEDVVRLTRDEVNISEELVTIRLGSISIALADPLDRPWRQLAARPGNDKTAAHPNSRWVFRGYSPGRRIHPASLRTRLSETFSTRAARLGTLHELTRLPPIAVIAEAPGCSPATIERHAIGSAATYAQHIAAAHEQQNPARYSAGT